MVRLGISPKAAACASGSRSTVVNTVLNQAIRDTTGRYEAPREGSVANQARRLARATSSPRLAALWLLTLAACAPAARPAATAAAPSSAATTSYDRTFQAPGLALRLELAPLPNLLYQLDCLSGAVLCSPDGYRELWSELGLDAQDHKALTRWKALRTRHTGTLPADAAAASAPLLLSGARVDVAERQRIAALRATDLENFEAAVALLSNDADAHELRTISTRFEERFMRFWRSHGHAAGAAYVSELASLLGDPFLLETLARVSRFDGLPADSHETYRIHLLVQPQTANPRLTAYQLEQDFAVEAPARAKAIDVIDVIAHELCHAIMFRMPTAAKAALVEAFVQSDDALSLVDYGMFDEALATSIGNGLVWRHYFPQEDFAEHSARGFRSGYRPAGALAAALLPRLEPLLTTDARAATPEFVRVLGEAALASYRAQGPTPLDYLHSHALAAAPALAPAAARVSAAAFAGFPYLREFSSLDAEAQAYIAEHSLVNAAVYAQSLTPVAALLTQISQPGTAPRHSDDLHRLAERSRGFVYALPRNAKTSVVLFVANEPSVADELVDAFLALREMHEGILVELAR